MKTLEDLTVDLGIGSALGFSSGSHQAMRRVWGPRFNDVLDIEWRYSLPN